MPRAIDEVRALLNWRTDRRATVRIDLVGWSREDLEALTEDLRQCGASSGTQLAPYRLHTIAKRIDDAMAP